MPLFSKNRCPRCFSMNTRPAESDGRICYDCGEWFKK